MTISTHPWGPIRVKEGVRCKRTLEATNRTPNVAGGSGQPSRGSLCGWLGTPWHPETPSVPQRLRRLGVPAAPDTTVTSWPQGQGGSNTRKFHGLPWESRGPVVTSTPGGAGASFRRAQGLRASRPVEKASCPLSPQAETELPQRLRTQWEPRKPLPHEHCHVFPRGC